MKRIRFIQRIENGTDENGEPIFLLDPCKIDSQESSFSKDYAIAQSLAYNGEVIVEDGGQPDPNEAATSPSQTDINKFMMMQAQDANDGIALSVPTLYNVWEAGKRYGYDGCEKIVRVPSTSMFKEDELYRCIQPHTSQADWQPQVTPALWTRINKSNAGTEADPIPAARGMEYEYGMYYSDEEDNGLYLCTRTGEQAGGKIVLQFMPHELVGHYFVFVRSLSE